MKKSRILYITQEISPYIPSSPISDLGRLIPQSMHDKGYEVRTFMPRYGMINERRNQLHEVIRLSGMNIVIDDSDHPLIIKVASLMPSRMQVYFIESEDYFHKSSKAMETEQTPADNDERIIFFSRGVLETVKRLRWEPVIVQCSGWLTSLIALYIKSKMAEDPAFRNVKVIYTLLDDKFEGTLDPRFIEKLIADGFDPSELEIINSDKVDYQALSKLAISTADAIVQARADIDPELLEFARQTGKPFITVGEDDDIADAHNNFYITLLQ